MDEGFDHLAESIVRHSADDLEGALAAALRARAAAPESRLCRDAVRYLEMRREGRSGELYARRDAFGAFVSSGGNLPLYDRVRTLLTARLRQVAPATMLDIGSGIGTTIVPVASALDAPPLLTLVEPSTALLETALAFAQDQGLAPDAYPYPIEDVLPRTTERWDVVLATWSLHTLAAPTRAEVLAALSHRCDRLLLAEFDDQSGSFEHAAAPARIRHIAERYEVGLAQYPGKEGERVRHSFLLPVFYGYFREDSRRTTYEQPISAWEAELGDAGLTVVRRELIHPYWWADAYLIEATGTEAYE